MNFNDTLLSVDLVLKSNSVPLIVGESGIGKTSLIKELCRRNNFYEITIDANLLKEGEIGGLPVVEDYIDSATNKKIKTTVYAVHNKLLEISRVLREDKYSKVVLFIDEINRCEHSVQQELMNLILNREINGYVLDDRVYVVAAMNPSSDVGDLDSGSYSVVNMDPAQENRFVWLYMESSAQEWINWALSDTGKINKVVVEFISDFNDYLHSSYEEGGIRATPRSWERVSRAYDQYEKNKEYIQSYIFYNVIKGNVGTEIAQDFMSFIENYNSDILKVQDLFDKSIDILKFKENIEKATPSKLYVLCKNTLSYLKETSYTKEELKRLCKLLNMYPLDLTMGVLKEIKSDADEELYRELLDLDEFIDIFFKCYGLLENRG